MHSCRKRVGPEPLGASCVEAFRAGSNTQRRNKRKMELGRGVTPDVIQACSESSPFFPISQHILILCWRCFCRYEREINRAERPAIRQIQEHDASPARAMVLCVSNIQLREKDEVEIELTDGWYRIRTASDKALVRAVKKGKIAVGRKLAIAGARVCHNSPMKGSDIDSYVYSSKVVMKGKKFYKLTTPRSSRLGGTQPHLHPGMLDWDSSSVPTSPRYTVLHQTEGLCLCSMWKS